MANKRSATAKRIAEMMRDLDFCVFTTRTSDGRLHARPMSNNGEVDFDGDSREPFVVENAGAHPVTRDNPLVTEDGIRCYAGMPLISRKGFALGTLCVLGKENGRFDESDLELLRELAARAVSRIESRRVGSGQEPYR